MQNKNCLTNARHAKLIDMSEPVYIYFFVNLLFKLDAKIMITWEFSR